jgi:HSP20 family protein
MLVKKNNSYFPSVFDAFFSNDANCENSPAGFSKPRFNVSENDNEFIVEVAVPGFEKQDFNIEIKENALEISSEKEIKEEDKNKKYHYFGFSYGSFKKIYSLPDNIDKEKISANYENGILKVLIPKDKELKASRQVSIQ